MACVYRSPTRDPTCEYPDIPIHRVTLTTGAVQAERSDGRDLDGSWGLLCQSYVLREDTARSRDEIDPDSVRGSSRGEEPELSDQGVYPPCTSPAAYASSSLLRRLRIVSTTWPTRS